MKIKSGFVLRRIGKEYVAVAVGKANHDFNGMMRMNDAGAYLWNEIEKGISEDQLVRKMMDRYEALDEVTARTDLKEFLDTIHAAVEE